MSCRENLTSFVSVLSEEERIYMNKNNRFRDTAMKIGAAAGRLDGKAHKAAQKAVKAVSVAKVELAQVTKQLEALKKQVAKSSKHLQAALK